MFSRLIKDHNISMVRLVKAPFIDFLLEDIRSNCVASSHSILDFWWHLYWVSKPGWISSLICVITCMQNLGKYPLDNCHMILPVQLKFPNLLNLCVLKIACHSYIKRGVYSILSFLRKYEVK